LGVSCLVMSTMPPCMTLSRTFPSRFLASVALILIGASPRRLRISGIGLRFKRLRLIANAALLLSKVWPIGSHPHNAHFSYFVQNGQTRTTCG
jgi:hypothetical protein